MKRKHRIIERVVGTAVVLLVLLALVGPAVSAQTTGESPGTKSSNPQTTGAPTSSAPTTSAPPPAASPPDTQPASPAAPVAEPGIEEQLLGAPMLQFALSTSTVDFGGSMSPGHVYTQTVTAAINSNQAWRISVTKSGDLQGATGSIPSSYFTFGAVGPAGFTTYQAPAGTEFGTDTLVVSGTRGSNMTTAITYRLSVPWTLAPDSYSAAHTYTAVQI